MREFNKRKFAANMCFALSAWFTFSIMVFTPEVQADDLLIAFFKTAAIIFNDINLLTLSVLATWFAIVGIWLNITPKSTKEQNAKGEQK